MAGCSSAALDQAGQPVLQRRPQRAALRLRLPPVSGGRGQFSFLDALCAVTTNPDLLDVVHALLAVHRAPSWAHDRQYGQSLSGDAAGRAQIAENYARLDRRHDVGGRPVD